jgi:hypothetical protein
MVCRIHRPLVDTQSMTDTLVVESGHHNVAMKSQGKLWLILVSNGLAIRETINLNANKVIFHFAGRQKLHSMGQHNLLAKYNVLDIVGTSIF